MRRLASLGFVLAGCAQANAPTTESRPPTPLPVAARALSAPSPTPNEVASEKTPEDITRELDRYFSEGYPPKTPSSATGRIASLSWGTWIQPTPNSGSLPLGGIRPGASLPLLTKELTHGHGRCTGFAQVELGFVCVGPRSTLDLDSRFIRESVWTAPAPGILPYHYAMSTGAPQLSKPVKLEGAPWKLGSRQVPKMRGWSAGHDELAEEAPIHANGPMPEFLKDGGQVPTPWGEPRGVFFKMAPKGTMIAYSRAFEAFGETWVLTSEMRVMPARGLKHYRVSTFHGVELGNDLQLPLAFMRKRAQPKWKKSGDAFVPADGSWPLRSWVGLTGVEVKDEKRTFLETKEPGIYIERPDATLVEARPKPPWETHGTDKWIHVRVNRGTLTLYEGPKPVFTTLMSPGKKDSTPYGRYFLESKHWFAAMSGESGDPTSFWIDAVPWTQYFDRPYAIHAAFWHEDFGERKSGGCVNLSPIDAKRVFEFTTPVLPKDWDTVGAVGPNSSTFVLVEA